jgi:hypothetical protein
MSSIDDPRYSYVPYARKVGSLSLRFFQQLAPFDCCKVVLGSSRCPVSTTTWRTACLPHMYILQYPVHIFDPEYGTGGIVKKVMSASCCHLCLHGAGWSFRMVQGNRCYCFHSAYEDRLPWEARTRMAMILRSDIEGYGWDGVWGDGLAGGRCWW